MDEKAKLIAIAPQLVVGDVVKTAQYYVDVFGFTLIGYFAEPPVYAMVQCDGFEVHFGNADSGITHNKHSIRREMPDFVIWVPEIELFFEEVKSKNADIIQGIEQRVYGREFIMADCDGHWVHVCD